MLGIGFGCLVCGSLARILNRDRGSDDEHFGQGAFGMGLQDHARHSGGDGQVSHVDAETRKALVSIDGAQFLQQLVPTLDGGRLRWIDEGELLHLPELQIEHAENDVGQIRTLDFGLCVFRARAEVLFAVQSHADSFRHTTTATFALLGTRLADGFDRQTLGLCARVVPTYSSKTRVHHESNARNCQ